MLKLLIVAVLIGLLIIVLRKLFEKPAAAPAPVRPPQDLANLNVTQARVGDTISASGAGDEFSDLDFTVDRRNRYESGDDEWYELSGLYRNRRVSLFVIDDQRLEVFAMTDQRVYDVRDIGVSEDDLARMDDQQDTSNYVTFENKRWFYKFSSEIGYFRDGVGEGEGFYSWEFREENGPRALSVEKWEGRPFEVFISRAINPSDVTVYRPA